jgi:hypothetical protein
MNSRYMILSAILVCHGLILNGQFNSPINPKNISVNPDLIIQVGAFRKEPNSSVLKEKLSAVIDKTVIVVAEDGFYKVRVTGFTTQEEMENFYPTLAFLGLKNFWVLPVKKHEEVIPEAFVQPDTIKEARVEDPALPVTDAETPVDSLTSIVLQVDVFHNKSEALAAQKRITTKLNLPVEIVQEWEYYKVFVTGFKSTEEANKYHPDIVKLGFPNISLIEHYKKKR